MSSTKVSVLSVEPMNYDGKLVGGGDVKVSLYNGYFLLGSEKFYYDDIINFDKMKDPKGGSEDFLEIVIELDDGVEKKTHLNVSEEDEFKRQMVELIKKHRELEDEEDDEEETQELTFDQMMNSLNNDSPEEPKLSNGAKLSDPDDVDKLLSEMDNNEEDSFGSMLEGLGIKDDGGDPLSDLKEPDTAEVSKSMSDDDAFTVKKDADGNIDWEAMAAGFGEENEDNDDDSDFLKDLTNEVQQETGENDIDKDLEKMLMGEMGGAEEESSAESEMEKLLRMEMEAAENEMKGGEGVSKDDSELKKKQQQEEEEEIKRKAKEEAEAEIKILEEETEKKADEEAEIKKLEEEAKRKAEEEAEIKKLEEEARRKFEEEEAEIKKLEEEAKRKADEEAEIKKLEEEAKRKADEEAEIKKLEEEAKRKADEEAEIKKLEEEAKRKAEEESEIKKLEEEAKKKAEEEDEIKKLEEEAKKKAEEEAEIKKLEEEAKKKAEEEDEIKKLEEEAKKKAEEEAEIKKLEEEAKRKADEEAEIKKLEEEAKQKAEEEVEIKKLEEEAKRKAEEEAEIKKLEEEAKQKAEEEAEAEKNRLEELRKAEKKRLEEEQERKRLEDEEEEKKKKDGEEKTAKKNEFGLNLDDSLESDILSLLNDESPVKKSEEGEVVFEKPEEDKVAVEAEKEEEIKPEEKKEKEEEMKKTGSIIEEVIKDIERPESEEAKSPDVDIHDDIMKLLEDEGLKMKESPEKKSSSEEEVEEEVKPDIDEPAPQVGVEKEEEVTKPVKPEEPEEPEEEVKKTPEVVEPSHEVVKPEDPKEEPPQAVVVEEEAEEPKTTEEEPVSEVVKKKKPVSKKKKKKVVKKKIVKKKPTAIKKKKVVKKKVVKKPKSTIPPRRIKSEPVPKKKKKVVKKKKKMIMKKKKKKSLSKFQEMAEKDNEDLAGKFQERPKKPSVPRLSAKGRRKGKKKVTKKKKKKKKTFEEEREEELNQHLSKRKPRVPKVKNKKKKRKMKMMKKKKRKFVETTEFPEEEEKMVEEENKQKDNVIGSSGDGPKKINIKVREVIEEPPPPPEIEFLEEVVEELEIPEDVDFDSIEDDPDHLHQARISLLDDDLDSFMELLSEFKLSTTHLRELATHCIYSNRSEHFLKILEHHPLLMKYTKDDDSPKFGGTSLLSTAIKYNSVEIVQNILRHKTRIKNFSDYTPLHLSVHSNNFEDDLVKHAVFCNKRDDDGWTPLHLATVLGKLGMMKELLKLGCSVDAVEYCDFYTPLHLSIVFGRFEAMKILLEHGSSCTRFTMSGYNALHLATKLGKMEILEYLIVDPPPEEKRVQPYAFCDSKTEQGKSALFVACQHAQVGSVMYLLDCGLDPNEDVDDELNGHLHALCSRHYCRLKDVDVFQLLIDFGANIEKKNIYNETPLYVALQHIEALSTSSVAAAGGGEGQQIDGESSYMSSEEDYVDILVSANCVFNPKVRKLIRTTVGASQKYHKLIKENKISHTIAEVYEEKVQDGPPLLGHTMHNNGLDRVVVFGGYDPKVMAGRRAKYNSDVYQYDTQYTSDDVDGGGGGGKKKKKKKKRKEEEDGLGNWKKIVVASYEDPSSSHQIQNKKKNRKNRKKKKPRNRPVGRAFHSSCFFRNQIFVYGGESSNQKARDDLWVFDFEDNHWENLDFALTSPTTDHPEEMKKNKKSKLSIRRGRRRKRKKRKRKRKLSEEEGEGETDDSEEEEDESGEEEDGEKGEESSSESSESESEEEEEEEGEEDDSLMLEPPQQPDTKPPALNRHTSIICFRKEYDPWNINSIVNDGGGVVSSNEDEEGEGEEEKEKKDILREKCLEYREGFLRDSAGYKDLSDAPNTVNGSQKMIIYGGRYNDGIPSSEVWSFNFFSMRWQKLTDGPPARYGHSAVYDVDRDRMIVFGGVGVDMRVVNDVWGYSCDECFSVKLEVKTSKNRPGPGPRMGHSSLFWDGRMYIYGGIGHELLGDLWLLDLRKKKSLPSVNHVEDDEMNWMRIRLGYDLGTRTDVSMTFLNESDPVIYGGREGEIDLINLPPPIIEDEEDLIDEEDEEDGAEDVTF